MPEVWKAVPGHQGYMVSNQGKVRSIDRKLSDGRFRKGQRLVASIDSGGYPSVTLSKRGGQHRVHVLVMLAFHGKPRKGQEVRHLDGNHLNAALSNLSYGTRADNEADKVLHGKSNRGERCGSAILREADVCFIKASGLSTQALATQFGVSWGCIYDIRRGKNWAWMS